MGDSDRIRIEPASSTPRITQSQAYDAYLRRYHRPARDEFPRMQVRYGLVTDAESGPASNGLGFVPEYRRTPAWVISLCGSPRPAAVELPPAARKRFSPPPDGGLLVVYLSDQPDAALLTGYYITAHSTNGLGGLGVSADNPDPAATHYRSVSWTQVGRRGTTLLVRYTTHRCYTLDHVTVDGPAQNTVSVILSNGPGSTCPAPSATAPYAEVTVDATRIRHGPTGELTFQPVSG